METATTTNKTLQIEGMTGDACVKQVTAALKGVKGVTTQSVKVGSAYIEADEAGCKQACAALKNLGFTARDGAGNGNAPARDGSGAQNPAKPNTYANSSGGPKGGQRPSGNASDRHTGSRK